MFFMELHRLSDVFDDEGRPLDEQPSPERLASGLAFDMRSCPYADSRRAHALPMNVSALGQMTRHWDPSMALLRGIRSAVVGHVAPVSVLELLQVCDVAAFAPVALRRDHVAFIPSAVSVTHKIVVGIQSALHAMILDGGHNQLLDAAMLHLFVDENSLLIGDDEVCAGPPHLITDVLQLLCDGDDGPAEAPSERMLHVGKLGHWTELITLLFAAQAAHLWRELASIPTITKHLRRFEAHARPPMMRAAFNAESDVIEPLRRSIGDRMQDLVLRTIVENLVPGDLLELHDLPIPRDALDVTIRYLTLERRYLRAMEHINTLAGAAPVPGPRRAEGLYVSGWLGPMVRDVVESAAGVTLQNTWRSTWIISGQ